MLMRYTNDYRAQLSEDLMHLFIADWFGANILEHVQIFLFLPFQLIVVLSFFCQQPKERERFLTTALVSFPRHKKINKHLLSTTHKSRGGSFLSSSLSSWKTNNNIDSLLHKTPGHYRNLSVEKEKGNRKAKSHSILRERTRLWFFSTQCSSPAWNRKAWE